MKQSILIIIFYCLSSGSFADASMEIDEGLEIKDEFPWELLIEDGELMGCIYENKFYSRGSITIMEGVPRTCEITISKGANWSELMEEEIEMYISNLEKRIELEEKSLKIGDEPLSKSEANLIRNIRRAQKYGQKISM